MLHSGRFTAILDANVLYPAPLRDLLLRLAEQGLFTPKWSATIQNEWMRNVLANRSDIDSKRLQRTATLMGKAFEDAEVVGFEPLEKGLTLPDPNDLHVLAAAILCKADVIVTFNTKDFPHNYVSGFQIEVQHPDEFVTNLITLDPNLAFDAFQSQVKSLKSPPQTAHQVLETLKKNGLVRSKAQFESML